MKRRRKPALSAFSSDCRREKSILSYGKSIIFNNIFPTMVNFVYMDKRRIIMIKTIIPAIMLLTAGTLSAQEYKVPVSENDEPMMEGKFEPTWESLKGYRVPEWFRNVKFGIWAHWGPQCVEGSGDWMARSLYMEGSNEYKYHVENYGHPSEVGFKDIIPLWKAEN